MAGPEDTTDDSSVRAMETFAVGWIGLGAMGLPMASRLLAAGRSLATSCYLDPAPTDQLAGAGGRILETPRAVADRADIVITMVRDESETDHVVLGDDGALRGMRHGSTLVVMSTLSATYCRGLAAMCARHGVDFLDAPVAGGVPAATAGTLSIMVGGDEAVVRRVRPILGVLGAEVLHLGGVGAGQLAKIVGNAIKMGTIALTTEGLSLGVRAGLDLGQLLIALGSSSARSHVIENWSYYYEFKREDRPGGPLDNLRKDVGFALDLAGTLEVEIPVLRCAASCDLGRLLDGDAADGART